MPNRSSVFSACAPESPDCSRPEPTEAPDEPDQSGARTPPGSGLLGRIGQRIFPPTPLNRFLGGVRPSTGQRQRLALARVFLKNPPLLILDEATSGLDSEVENLIHDAVRRLMKGRTLFLIAHRLASAVDADVIVVLEHGEIVEIGPRAELQRRAGVYARLYNEQTRKLRVAGDRTARVPGSLSPASAGQHGD